MTFVFPSQSHSFLKHDQTWMKSGDLLYGRLRSHTPSNEFPESETPLPWRWRGSGVIEYTPQDLLKICSFRLFGSCVSLQERICHLLKTCPLTVSVVCVSGKSTTCRSSVEVPTADGVDCVYTPCSGDDRAGERTNPYQLGLCFLSVD